MQTLHPLQCKRDKGRVLKNATKHNHLSDGRFPRPLFEIFAKAILGKTRLQGEVEQGILLMLRFCRLLIFYCVLYLSFVFCSFGQCLSKLLFLPFVIFHICQKVPVFCLYIFAATVAPFSCATFQPADPMFQKESVSCESILIFFSYQWIIST